MTTKTLTRAATKARVATKARDDMEGHRTLDTAALLAKGFREVSPAVFVRLKTNGKRVSGMAMWHHEGATLFAGARMEIREARKLVLRLCRSASAAFPASRRRRARKLLSAVLAKNLQVAGDSDPDVRVVEDLVGLFSETEVGGRRRRRRKRRSLKRGINRLKNGINRLAKKAAKNKVMGKLREGYARVLEGPVGSVAAKAAGRALQAATGIPAPVGELAVRAHQRSQASRMRDGGMAGVVAQASGRGGVRSAARRESKRFGRAARRTGREAVSNLASAARSAMQQAGGGGLSGGFGRGGGGMDFSRIADLARAGEIGAIVDEVEEVQPRGMGLRAAYNLGSCL